MSDRRLRSLFEGQSGRRTGETCPEPDVLWASTRGELDPAENRRVIEHTGRCPSCAEDWRLARHLGRDAGGREAEGSVVPLAGAADGRRETTLGHSMGRLALAASVLLAVAVVALWIPQTRLGDDPGSIRSGRGAGADGPRIEALTPEDRPLSRDEPVLRWRGPEGARYDLTVTVPRTGAVHRAPRLEGTEHRLPAGVIAALPPGTRLDWQVKATLPDGDELLSPTYLVRLE